MRLVRIIPPRRREGRSREAALHRFRPAGRPRARHWRHEARQRDRRRASGGTSLLFRWLPAGAGAGQTVADVCHAEARFVEAVAALHPEAEGKPCLIGNCQAGWQIMIMSAIVPICRGRSCSPGSPLSYWAGVRGKNPMRYLGGLLGGTWLTSLAGDLGNGIFDGAHLVANFESLHPSNTYWKKAYDLYSKVDTEAPRYLEFEKWWGSPVLLTAQEMQASPIQLFVGTS